MCVHVWVAEVSFFCFSQCHALHGGNEKVPEGLGEREVFGDSRALLVPCFPAQHAAQQSVLLHINNFSQSEDMAAQKQIARSAFSMKLC